MKVGAIISIISVTAAVMLTADGFAAQQVFAYPNAGQTEAQQSQDRFECHQWSVAQSGFDPSSAAPLAPRPAAPPPPGPRTGYSEPRQRRSNRGFLGIGDGGVLGDAATGAALGAAGGPGVSRAIDIFRADIVRTMRLLGCGSIADLNRSYVDAPPAWFEKWRASGP